MYRKAHSLSSMCAAAGFWLEARFSGALEAYTQEVEKKPEAMNASAARTIAQTLDLILNLLSMGAKAVEWDLQTAKLLVVDDELISRRAVVFALEKVQYKPVSLADPRDALKLLQHEQFDLILLDINMPGMSGLDLCQKIRTIPAHKATPVIFISSMSDFQSRAQSALSGGADLIAKPFLLLELGLKAMLHLVKARIGKAPGA
jgi:CheY-like chemotaxis protein